jgi:iron complex outermembrane receptor protein
MTRCAFAITVLATTCLVLAPRDARAAALAGDTLRGRITTVAGQPIRDVAVQLPELDRNTRSGADGDFLLADVPPGQHTVVFRRPGFAPVVQSVNLTQTTRLEVVLKETPFELEPVVVTGTRAPVQPLLSVLPTATLGEDQLRRHQSVSLAHMIDNIPGVHTLSTGMEIGKPVIRGLTGASVLVAENGSRLEDYSWSDEDGPAIDARMADRVEVVRGPASIVYGSDAMGGVVNVIPASLPDALGRSPFTRGSVEAYGASNNHELGGVLKLEGADNGFGWRAVAIGRGAEALRTPLGELDNTGFTALNGEALAGFRGSRGNATVRYSRYGGEFKLLEANGPPPGATEEQDQGPERKASDDRVQFASNVLLRGLRLEAKAQWQRHWLQEVSDEPTSPGDTVVPGQESTQFDLLLNTVTLDVLAHHHLGTAIQGTIGASGELQHNDTRGPIPLVPDARRSSLGVYALERATSGPLTVVGGARVDGQRLTSDSNATLGSGAHTLDWTAVSAEIGTVLEPVHGVAFEANLGRGWRAPTLFELFSAGPEIGDARYEIGSSALKTETSINMDGGVRLETDRVRGSVQLYRNFIINYIYLAPTNQFVDSLRVYRHEQADALLRGIEASLEMQPVTDLTVRTRFDAVLADNERTGEYLPLTPPPRGTAEIEYQTTELSWLRRLYVSVSGEKDWTQTRLNAFDVQTDGYELLNFAAGFDKALGNRALRVDVSVHNATNVSYKDFLSRYKEFALSPGRNILLRIGTEF